ncbi:hypothetical protein BKA64DRAFT_633990 [Cadophora sp. MPI-SDFR-AT-0126]|nr:hypothetical protein BKA64DRAFT_633990 [Leotiomycetes sp. MPI-SDFR-AT-0126]
MAAEDKQLDAKAVDTYEDIDPRALASELSRQLEKSQANVRALLQLHIYQDEVHKWEKHTLTVYTCIACTMLGVSAGGLYEIPQSSTTYYERKIESPITNLEYGRLVLRVMPVALATVGSLTSLIFKTRSIRRLLNSRTGRNVSEEEQGWGDLIESISNLISCIVFLGAKIIGKMKK